LEQAARTYGFLRSLNFTGAPIHGLIDCIAVNVFRQSTEERLPYSGDSIRRYLAIKHSPRNRPTQTGSCRTFFIRDTESSVHRRVTELVDAACERDLFDADAVRDLYDDHMNGANNAGILATLTTLEYWIGSHLE
jgi:hypothetical protein